MGQTSASPGKSSRNILIVTKKGRVENWSKYHWHGCSWLLNWYKYSKSVLVYHHQRDRGRQSSFPSYECKLCLESIFYRFTFHLILYSQFYRLKHASWSRPLLRVICTSTSIKGSRTFWVSYPDFSSVAFLYSELLLVVHIKDGQVKRMQMATDTKTLAEITLTPDAVWRKLFKEMVSIFFEH